MKDAMRDRAPVLTACYHESLRKRWPCVAASLQAFHGCLVLTVTEATNNEETDIKGAHSYSAVRSIQYG